MNKVRQGASEERLEKLLRQYELNTENCLKCPFRKMPTVDSCAKCPTYKELRDIGKWLLKETVSKRGVVVPKKGIKANRGETYQYIDALVTPEDYWAFKTAGMKDINIADSIKVSVSTFKNWKKLRGLTITRGAYKK